MKVSSRLRERMKANKISAPKLSAHSGIPLGSIKSILSEQSMNPRATTLIALSNSLNCEIVDLLSDQQFIPGENNTASNDDSSDDALFKASIDVVEAIASEKGLKLDGDYNLKKQCVDKIFKYAQEKARSSKTTPKVDRLYAEWVLNHIND